MDGATAVTGGVGGTTFGALSSIGSDLSVSVSFNIARELLSAAGDEQLSEDELSTGKRDEVGRNKMLQLFGHQVSKQYSREKGLFKNPVRVHVRARA